MATDSIMGLFATPEQYQQAQYNQVLDRNIALAKLTPMQRNVAQLGAFSNQLGGAIGSALGAEDPMLKRQAQRRAFIQNIDMSNPQSLVQGIRASTNDPELANYLLGKYKELTSIQKEQSVISKNEKWEKAEADKTQVRNLLADVETRLSNNEPVSQVELNKARLAYSEKGQPTPRFDPQTQTIVMMPGIDMTVFPNLTKAFGKTSGPTGGGGGSTGAGTATVVETPMSEEARRNRLNSLESSQAQLQNTLDTITQTAGLVGNKTTGWGAYLSSIPTSDAMTLADNTEQIKASVALTKLMEMKKESKTGASGLGALNIKELETIQSILGKLNPKSANYANDLKKVNEFFVRAKGAMDEEIKLTQGKVQQSPATPKPSGMSGRNPQLQATEEALIERNMAANRGASREAIVNALIKAGKLPATYK